MNRAVAVLVALLLAVHVSAPGMPAPAPVLLAFASVIGAQLYLIYRAAFRQRVRRRRWTPWTA